MVQFDNQYRQVKVKIVYYGPALGGKTTCLQHIHRVVDPQRRTRLYSLNTSSDRTLFFDLLSLNLGRIRGYRLAIQLYTVPGQVQYNATRRAVLAGADGVVFVADSQRDQRKANIQSLDNLRDNLEANGLDADQVPLVLQYNKRDLDDLLAVDVMDADLNPRQVQSFGTLAVAGGGVMEAFGAITETTLVAVADRLGIDTASNAVDRLRQQVRSAFSALIGPMDRPDVADDVETTTPEAEVDDARALQHETLVGEAVRANLAMTEVSARLETASRQLERKATGTAAIAAFGQEVVNERDPTGVLRTLLETAVLLFRAQAAAVLTASVDGHLRQAMVHGRERDPLLVAEGGTENHAAALAESRDPILITRALDGEADDPLQVTVEAAGFSSALAVPLLAHDRRLGVLTAYRGGDRPPFDEDELELGAILGATAALGYSNALAFRHLEAAKVGLESTVVQQSDELAATVGEIGQLNRELETMDGIKNELITRVAGRLEAPVASLVTATQALGRFRESLPEKSARIIDLIRGEAQALSETIESVVQASHLAARSDGAEPRTTPLQELLRDAVSPLRDLAKKLEVDLKVLIPSGLEEISCDPSSLATALRALIKNAIEFNRRRGEVRVEVHRSQRGDSPWIEFRVTDTGMGIPKDDVAKVFDAFWQGGAAANSERRGIGLGLVIARQVAVRHGGDVTLASRVGEGTEVSLFVPQ
jgi:signal transduction histidine kinase/signal recognition particle receptor subunit beta